MASGDIALRLLITGSATGAIAEITKMATAAMGVNGAMATVGVLGAAAVIGIGVASVKAAGDFQQNMNLLVTSAGESKNAIGAVSKGILQMSVDTGTSTDQLAKGMYFVESSGYHGAEGLAVMTSAAQGAKTENADLGVVAKALTTLMVDYKMKASDSAKAMNGLIATVQNGKTTLQDLSSAMGAVLPIASSLHISFPQVAGAMDTMTNAGMPAQQAAQNLAHVLVALSAPSGVATKAMASVGLSAQQVKDALVNQGLPEALQLIEDHVGKKFPEGSVANETALKNIMGGLVGLKLAAQLTGGSLKETEDNIAKVTNAMNANGSAVMGWDVIQGNLNFQLARVKEALNALLITIGQALLPVVTTAVKGFADFLSGLIKFASSGAGVTTIVTALGVALAAVGVIVAGALKSAFTGAIASLLGTAAATATEAGASDVAAKSALELSVALKLVAVSAASMALASGVTTTELAAASIAYDTAAASATADAVATTAAIAPTVAFGVALWTALAPILPIVLAIAALVAGFILLYKNCEPFRNAIDGVVAGLKQLWTWFVQQIQPALKELGDTLKNAFIPVWQQLVDAWKNEMLPALKQLWEALQPLGPVLKILAEGVLGSLIIILIVVTAAIVGLIKAAAALAQMIATVLGGAIKIVTGIIQEFAGVLSLLFDLITGHWSKLGDDLKTIWDGIKNQLSGAWQILTGIFEGVWNAIAQYVQGIGDVIGGPLKAFWDGFSSWFGDTMSAIGTTARNVWTAIASFTGEFFSELGDIVRKGLDAIGGFFGETFSELGDLVHKGLGAIGGFFGEAFSELGDLAHKGLDAVVGFFVAAFQTIGGWFTWLYNHNTYIELLCSAIKDLFAKAIATVQYAWNAFASWWPKFWGGIGSALGNFFSGLGTITHNALGKIGDMFSGLGTIAHDVIGKIGDMFSGLGTIMHDVAGKIGDMFSGLGSIMHDAGGKIGDMFSGLGSIMHDVGGKIGDMFSGLGSIVKNAMDSLNNALSSGFGQIGQTLAGWGQGIAKFFGDLAPNAFQWGANLITQFIAGIGSMFSALGSKVHDAAQVVSNFLGFKSPTKEGPGSTAHLWAPALVAMFASGLVQGIPKVRSASMQLAGGVASAFAVGNGAFAVSGASGSGSNQPGTMNVSVNLDSRVLMQAMNVQQSKEVRIQGGYRHG